MCDPFILAHALIGHLLTSRAWRAVSRRLSTGAADRGQATAEYAVVLVGVAVVATMLFKWASSTGEIGKLMDKVIQQVKGKV